MDEILPGLFRVKVPLPKSPLGFVNSYVIRGDARPLVIDTGLNHEDCRRALMDGLSGLGIDPKSVDVFVTHFHEDHIGLVPLLATDGTTVHIGKVEADMIIQYMSEESQSPWWKRHSEFLRTRGFPEEELPAVVASHPDHGYEVRGRLNLRSLKEGDVIDAGEYSFRCIETPGHSPGHICLYDPAKRVLISGDHILGAITPIISLWSDEVNPLKDYLASLDKVRGLDVEHTLPGHGEVIEDLPERLQELKDHHQERGDEVLSILSGGVQDGFKVASQMTWDVPEPWDRFPPSQRWFAFGEALAHIKYLEEQGKVQRQLREGNIVFSLA
jgi:glyoxylase-like metal-dependent hydrolase (beta-lactamase superfamily II)